MNSYVYYVVDTQIHNCRLSIETFSLIYQRQTFCQNFSQRAFIFLLSIELNETWAITFILTISLYNSRHYNNRNLCYFIKYKRNLHLYGSFDSYYENKLNLFVIDNVMWCIATIAEWAMSRTVVGKVFNVKFRQLNKFDWRIHNPQYNPILNMLNVNRLECF